MALGESIPRREERTAGETLVTVITTMEFITKPVRDLWGAELGFWSAIGMEVYGCRNFELNERRRGFMIYTVDEGMIGGGERMMKGSAKKIWMERDGNFKWAEPATVKVSLVIIWSRIVYLILLW